MTVPAARLATGPDHEAIALDMLAERGPVLARLDPSERIVEAGPVLSEILGWSPDEVVGLHLIELLDPDWAAGLGDVSQLRHALVGGPALHGEDPIGFIHRSGQVRWLALHALPLQGGGLLVLAGDVSSARTRTTELERSDRLLRQAVLHAGIGCFEWSIRTGGHRWSEQLFRLCRLPPGTVPSDELILSLVHPQDRARYDAAVATAVDGAEPLDLEIGVLLPDGCDRILRISGQPVTGVDGRVERVVGIVEDVTEARRLDAELQTRHRLESVGRLASGMAHDFNNLLMVIGGYVELAKQTLDDSAASGVEEAVAHLDQARASTDQAAALAHQVLVYARARPGAPEPVDLVEAVRAVTGVLRRTMAGGAELVVSVPETGGAVIEADRGQLEQVVMNLLLNARDATGPGDRIHLELTSVAAAGGGRRALLMVADDGTGMDEATRQRALEPFFTTKGDQDGSGLGLATVHSVVNGLGGGIEILSSPGSGTSIIIDLPLSATTGPIPEAPVSLPPAGRGQHVLVVDDDPLLCGLMARVLTAGGYRTTTSVDVTSALEVAAHCGDVALLVSDVVLTDGWSGPDLGAELRQDDPGLPVVLVSGSGDAATDLPAPVLQKPVSQAELLLAVGQALDGGRSG